MGAIVVTRNCDVIHFKFQELGHSCVPVLCVVFTQESHAVSNHSIIEHYNYFVCDTLRSQETVTSCEKCFVCLCLHFGSEKCVLCTVTRSDLSIFISEFSHSGGG